MGLTTETLQNLIISHSNESLESYTNKINRRLAVLANLGQRFGQEGQGFYIEHKTFSDIISVDLINDFRNNESQHEDIRKSPLRLCVRLNLENPENNTLKYLGYLDIELLYYDTEQNTWHTYSCETEPQVKLTPHYTPFFVDFFVAYAKFLSELLAEKKPEYFRQLFVEEEGILKEENITSCVVAFLCDSKFDIIYDSSSNLPVCLSQPYCITSDQYYSERYESLFTAKFTTAVNVGKLSVDADLTEEVGDFFAVEYGLGIKDTGEILFNGLGSDIVIDGADGANALVFIIKATISENVIKTFGSNSNIEAKLETGTIYGPDGIRDINEINYKIIDWYNSSAGKIAYYIQPSSDYFTNHEEFCDGAIAFSFISCLTVENNIQYEYNISTILIYNNNQWVPLTNNDEEASIFTFYDLVDAKTIEINIRKNLARYFSAEIPDENQEYFKHKEIIFKDSKVTNTKDSQFDAVYYRLPGNYILNTARATDYYQQEFNTAVFNVNYQLAYTPETLKDQKTITFEDMILESQNTLKRSRPRLYYNQEKYSEGTGNKVSFELPTIALNNTSLFMPSIVDELRVYNIWDPEMPKAGWTDDTPFGIPEAKLDGTKLTFGELELTKKSEESSEKTLVYTPVAKAELSEQWKTSEAGSKFSTRKFTFSIKKEDVKYPLEITVNNVLYHDLNTLVITDNINLEHGVPQQYNTSTPRVQLNKETLKFFNSTETEGISDVSFTSEDTTHSLTELNANYLLFTDRSEKIPEAKVTLKLDNKGITINRDFNMRLVNDYNENTFIKIQKRKFTKWSEQDHQDHHNKHDLQYADAGIGYWRFPLTDIFSNEYIKFDSTQPGNADLLQNRTIEIAPNYNGVGRDEVYRVNLYEAYMRGYIQESDIVFNANLLDYFYYPCINNVPVSHKSSMWVEWNLK